MSYVETKEIDPKEIDFGKRLRPVDGDAELASIQASMAQVGQLQPVVVFRQKDRPKPYGLVVGAHRTTAAMKLGIKIRAEIHDIETNAHRRLAEIDENLGRHDLNPLDRAVFVGERRTVFEEVHGDPKARGKNYPQLDFTKETAALIERSEELVKRALRIHKNISPDIRGRLAGTRFAKSEGELYALAKHDAVKQAKILDLVLAKNNPLPSVSVAAAKLSGKKIIEKLKHEVELQRLQDGWKRGTKRSRKAFMEWLRDELGVIKTFDEGSC